jgi:putative membrane protein
MDTGSERMLASADVAFAMRAAQTANAQIQLGRLALTKAQSPAVKQFGRNMVAVNTKANDQLNGIARNQAMTLPANMDSRYQAQYDRLQLLSGSEFDKVYMTDMLKDHRALVKAFMNEVKKGKDTAIKNFAAQNFDGLEQHLAAAQSITAQLMSSRS